MDDFLTKIGPAVTTQTPGVGFWSLVAVGIVFILCMIVIGILKLKGYEHGD